MGEMQKAYMKEEYPHSAITPRIIAAANEIHRDGYQDVLIQTRLGVELSSYEIEFARELGMDVTKEGTGLRKIRC